MQGSPHGKQRNEYANKA
ncbi:unnamed protein product [Victoria cruziana]